MTRNAVYNRQMKLIEKLEEEGKIFVIRPLIPTVSRMEKDYDKLQHFYMHGNRLMEKEYQGLLKYLTSRGRMRPETLLDFMGVAEHLKCNMRHSQNDRSQAGKCGRTYVPSMCICVACKRRISGL